MINKVDTVLNKTFLDLVVYSVGGYLVGFGASILFENKPPKFEMSWPVLEEATVSQSIKQTLITLYDIYRNLL